MERAIQIYAIINFGVIGLSHVIQPRAWISFFTYVRERGEAGVFATAFLSLAVGSIIVAFHNVWSGIPMALTLVGRAQVGKALIYFTLPRYGLRKLQPPSDQRPAVFVIPGVVFLLLAAAISYHVRAGS